MKVDLTLEKDITNTNGYYVLLNNVFYIKIKKALWYELAGYLNIKVD